MDNTPLRRRSVLDQSDSPSSASSPSDHYWDHDTESERGASSPGSVRGVVKELLETAIFILLVFFIVRGIVQNFKIEGSSMEPSLHSGQYILVNKIVYFHFDINAPLRLLPGQEDLSPRTVYPFQQPQRGDVIVFEYPRDVSKDYIKRVIGLPGDTVEFRDGSVYVNGFLLDESYLASNEITYCNVGSACSSGQVVVPEGKIFVMGDNRLNSSDSREWDTLPMDRIIGQAWVLYYPIQDWGVIPHHSYAADQ
jgi:signal peptidase I